MLDIFFLGIMKLCQVLVGNRIYSEFTQRFVAIFGFIKLTQTQKCVSFLSYWLEKLSNWCQARHLINSRKRSVSLTAIWESTLVHFGSIEIADIQSAKASSCFFIVFRHIARFVHKGLESRYTVYRIPFVSSHLSR